MVVKTGERKQKPGANMGFFKGRNKGLFLGDKEPIGKSKEYREEM